MISRSFCWAKMNKMTKKWDLETSNAETELKIGIYTKNQAKQVLLKNFDSGQSQWSTDDVCWRGSVTSPKAYVPGSEAQQARGAREWAWDWRVVAREAHGRYWRRVAARGTRAREAETSAGPWRHVWFSFWPFLVRFCSGLAVLSFYAFSLAIEWQNVDIRVSLVLWAWRRWLASDSDDWMKARATEECRRCPQESESQRNDSDTILTI